ncbi:MAG: hypothetical protein KGI06_01930 [Candidatus Micrarchaeota archaeon]|nr:hypothetical protein [Candidatus Micrarchaeota archaeon]
MNIQQTGIKKEKVLGNSIASLARTETIPAASLLEKLRMESANESGTNYHLVGYVKIKSVESGIKSILKGATTVEEIKRKLGI